METALLMPLCIKGPLLHIREEMKERMTVSKCLSKMEQWHYIIK